MDASVQLDVKLATDSDEEYGVPSEFLQELFNNFDEEPALRDGFQEAIEHLSMDLSSMEMCDLYKPYLDVGIRCSWIS